MARTRTTQKHVEHQDATDIQQKLFCVVIDNSSDRTLLCKIVLQSVTILVIRYYSLAIITNNMNIS